MKKRLLLTGMAICMLACGCDSLNNDSDNKTKNATEKVTESTTEETTTEETTTEAPETIYNTGDTALLENWEINISEIQIVDSIEDGMMVYSSKEEGNKLLRVFASATNKGEEADKFCPSYGFTDDLNVKILNGENEYLSLILLGYGEDLHDKTVEPQSSVTGNLIFEIPESVSSAADELIVAFSYKGKNLKFKVR